MRLTRARPAMEALSNSATRELKANVMDKRMGGWRGRNYLFKGRILGSDPSEAVELNLLNMCPPPHVCGACGAPTYAFIRYCHSKAKRSGTVA